MAQDEQRRNFRSPKPCRSVRYATDAAWVDRGAGTFLRSVGDSNRIRANNELLEQRAAERTRTLASNDAKHRQLSDNSIGLVVFFNHEVQQTELMKQAGAAMYQAQAAGRNRILLYGGAGADANFHGAEHEGATSYL